MKKAIAAFAVAVAVVTVPASAGASVKAARPRSCPTVQGDNAPIVWNVRAQGTSCLTADWLTIDEWNGSVVHWDYPASGGRWYVTWTVTWPYRHGAPVTYYRATSGRAAVTWEQGT
jgi:hypothetical protein